jgi:alanine dehydrogenase
MIIGVVKERKDQENRVGLTPVACSILINAGNTVLVETNAGAGSGFSDQEYEAVGTVLKSNAETVYAESQMIVKVKEPLACEYGLLKENQILFTYLHLAASEELTSALQRSRCVAFAYEMVQEKDGSLPLLAPMSEIAGRMSIQIAAKLLEQSMGGPGIMLGGVPGVAAAEVTIIGGGIVGSNASQMAVGLGARVTILDSNPNQLRQLDQRFGGRISTLMSNSYNVAASLRSSDVVIGAVLIPGRKAPKIVTREMVADMKQGAVIIDVAIDQGGCVETIDRTTSHSDPIYVINGVIHYAVPNIPGIVPRTSTLALTNATLPYVKELASKGWERAMQENAALSRAASVIQGNVINL